VAVARDHSGMRHGAKTVADMGRSIVVVLICVFVVLLVGAGRVLLFPGRQQTPAAVTYRPEVALARQALHADLPAPGAVPAGWVVTSATVSGRPGSSGQRLVLGFATPGGNYAAEQAGAPRGVPRVRAFLAEVLGARGLAVHGRLTVGGDVWQRRTDGHHDEVLTRTAEGITTVLLGTGGWPQLRTLAAALTGSTSA
jgi:hypothetical protein